MNLLDGLVGGVRAIYENGTAKAFKTGLDFVDMAITVGTDRLSLVVAGIRGVPVSSTAPAEGQVLTYTGTQWAPAAGLALPAEPPVFSRADYSALEDMAKLLEVLDEMGIVDFTGNYPG